MAELNMAYLSSLKNRAKLLLSSLPVSPSRVLRAPSTSLYHIWVKQKIEFFIGSRISKFLRPAQRYDDFKTYQNHLPSRLSWQNLTWHICQV